MNTRHTQRWLRYAGTSLVVSMAAAAVGIPAAAPVAATPRSTGAAGVAFGVPAQWDTHEGSASASATEILEGVRTQDKPTLVAVYEVDGKPVVKTAATTSRLDAAQEIRRQQKDPGLLSIEVDVPVSLVDGTQQPLALNDTRRSELWGLDKVQAEAVWNLSRGGGITVAVIDTGVAPHEDLQGSFVPGIDVVDRLDPRRDGHGHGTHVAGTIAATANNNLGIAGVAPDARIMPVRVLNDRGSGYASDVAEGLIWAANNGAQVVNLSLGSPQQSEAMSKAVEYAIARGVTVIAANGNDGSNAALSYPAAYPGVVAVGATTKSNTRAFFSSQNSSVDIAAPGADILSTLPNNRYASWNGTSMAAPHVAGVAALVASYAQKTGKSVSVPGVLTSTSEDLGAPGWDNEFGQGAVNALLAMRSLLTDDTAPAAPVNVRVSSQWWSRATVSWDLPTQGPTVSQIRVNFANGTPACLVAAPATTCEINGLEADSEYTVTATALGVLRGSQPSRAVTFRTAQRVDLAGDTRANATQMPTSLTASDVLDNNKD
ncbi:MAG: S8 family serine peptidase, partial [Actinomycetota bacterium]